MSAGIGAIYSVPLDELRAIPGSREKKLAQMIQQDFIGREEIDEIFEEYDPPNTLYAATLQILNGEKLDIDKGALYGYAVEGLCWAIGSTFILPMGFPSYEELDKFLASRKCQVRLEDLLFSGFPLLIPEPKCYPMAGCWQPEQVLVASEFFSSLGEATGELAVGIAEVRRWIVEAVERETDALVGFCIERRSMAGWLTRTS